MRHVTKREKDKTKLLACKETYQALCTMVSTGNKGLIKEAIYREPYETKDEKRSRVADQLAIAYKNKCAYCEELCRPDIEHYRPKKAVKEDATHGGYYWLCYEWTNLIPACINCNREGAKHNQFPVLGPRVTQPPLLPDGKLNLELCKANASPLKDERPYLLHPEIDYPEDYFEFEIDSANEGIRIVGTDTEGRGNKTIEICKLNRQHLRIQRVQSVIKPFEDAIQSHFGRLMNGSINETDFVDRTLELFECLESNSMKEEYAHILLRKYIIVSPNNFEKIVLPFLQPEVRRIVLEAFKQMKKGK